MSARHKAPPNRCGMLTLLGPADRIKGAIAYRWLCDCGTEIERPTGSFKRSKMPSCGCLKPFLVSEARCRHGYANQRGILGKMYGAWVNMRKRCNDPKDKRFSDYGGRGISVCDRWLVFENFLNDMGHPPDGTSLDRYPDKNGNYEPGNCRWATAKQQARNKRTNRMIDHEGRNLTIAEWAEITGLPRYVILKRLNVGWPMDRLFSPLRPSPKARSTKP